MIWTQPSLNTPRDAAVAALQAVTALGAEEQKLQEKCNRLLDLVLSTNNNANNNNAAAGAVRTDDTCSVGGTSFRDMHVIQTAVP